MTIKYGDAVIVDRGDAFYKGQVGTALAWDERNGYVGVRFRPDDITHWFFKDDLKPAPIYLPVVPPNTITIRGSSE